MRTLPSALLCLAALASLSCGPRPSATVESIATTTLTPAQAAEHAAKTSDACTRIHPFYWEVGAANGAKASGRTGDESVGEDTRMAVASATKWLFAAYVLERFAGELDEATRDALRMLSGHTGFGLVGCRKAETIASCLAESNTKYNAALAGRFDYDGGHYQHWSVENGLGDLSSAGLAAELSEYLGPAMDLSFTNPRPAGGARMTPQAYAEFLRKILRGDLRMRDYLGADAVCTLPAACTMAASSPAPEDLHYSYGHWVEDDPAEGDGAFSSAGLFGFYPWITADKLTYGLVAREAWGLQASWASVLCGREIRAAFGQAAP